MKLNTKKVKQKGKKEQRRTVTRKQKSSDIQRKNPKKWDEGTGKKRLQREAYHSKESKRDPNYRRNTRVYARTSRRIPSPRLGTPTILAACEAKKRGITRTRQVGVASRTMLPCDIHVSRLFMTRGTSGRTRTTVLRNATRAPNTYIIRGKKRTDRWAASRLVGGVE